MTLVKQNSDLDTIISTMQGIIYIAGILGGLFQFRKQVLWIKSPQGKYYKLPFKLALRIIRKRGWFWAEVEPVMSRWQHLKASLGVKIKWA